MNRVTELFRRFVEWATEALERAQAHDRDAYVERSSNEREASQRIHRLEEAAGGLQA